MEKKKKLRTILIRIVICVVKIKQYKTNYLLFLKLFLGQWSLKRKMKIWKMIHFPSVDQLFSLLSLVNFPISNTDCGVMVKFLSKNIFYILFANSSHFSVTSFSVGLSMFYFNLQISSLSVLEGVKITHRFKCS